MQGHENEGLLPENGGDERGRLGVEGGIIGENEVTEARNEMNAKEGNFEVKDGFGGEPEAINNSDSESEADLESRIETKEESEDQTGIRDETEGEVENSEKEGEIDDRKREVEVVEHNIQTGSPERIEPQISEGKPSQTKKTNKKGLIAVLAVACLVVIGLGIGLWTWNNGGNKQRVETEEAGTEREDEEDVDDSEAEVIVYTGMPGEENAQKEAMRTAYNEAMKKVNEIAYKNGGWSTEGSGDDYNYEIIEKNIDEYLEGVEDVAKRNQVATSAIDLLASIGDTEGAKKIMDELNTEDFSLVEWFCYYQGVSSYYLAIEDDVNYKESREKLLKTISDTEK